ncbi:RagB/SusD family nutrient uptake outer membrane protein [Spirosoma endbachense]|uniref:RagB/SusD family nutrient uptake outer membrane protein n=1 Tax=Spirosoma endbachense TaxID=2666025 RepID=A0A6P1VXV6_9BACT|nr:RagB/SusD family nutrient uptake outer membrane protein [Spirosoma endbachense]QHV96539.1 RagB/SusD family nutrient uptake outer membrane protein [Spirosoma endbachense]
MRNKLFILICLSTMVVSCEVLDQPPLDKISNDQYWKTPSDLENYMYQFYPSFPTYRSISNNVLGTIGRDAVQGSDHQITQTPVNALNGTQSIVLSGGNWTWDNIRGVNIFFENYTKVNAPAENIRQYVGEAHFFKAWYYFEKVRQYGDVPSYSTSLQLDSKELYNPRTPRTGVVDSILWHLDQAVDKLFPLSSVSGGNNRLSKEAALLFKSRVALFEGSWQKYHAGTAFGSIGGDPKKYFTQAAQAAAELMKPGKYKVGITGTSADDYSRLFSSTNLSGNNEIILWAKFDKNLNTLSHNFQQSVTAYTNPISVTYELIQNYLGKDGKFYDYAGLAKVKKGSAFLDEIGSACDPRLKQVVWVPGQTMWDNSAGKSVFSKPFLDLSNSSGFQLHKGADPKDPTAGGAQGFSTACETGAVIFRYAEALLNYAEAKSELGEVVDYSVSLNLLRKRAGMPDFTVQSDPNRAKYANFGYSLTDELYEIRRERAVELACEGFRYDDWRRWRAHALFTGKRPLGFPFLQSEYAANLVVPTNADGLVDPFKTNLPAGYNFNAGRDYLESIPTNELTLNPNLKQNPGW